MKVADFKHGRVPRSIREKQILDIAEKQFIEFGYETTTVESIRLEAGVSRPMIYDYYGSKDRLYLACVQRARSEYEKHLLKLLDENDAASELLLKGSNLYFSIIETSPKRWLVLFGGSSVPMFGDLGDELHKIRQGTIQTIFHVLQMRYPNADKEQIDAFAHAIFAVGEHLGHWWLKHPEIPKSRVISHHISFINKGLSCL